MSAEFASTLVAKLVLYLGGGGVAASTIGVVVAIIITLKQIYSVIKYFGNPSMAQKVDKNLEQLEVILVQSNRSFTDRGNNIGPIS
jgi:hypothetical protein